MLTLSLSFKDLLVQKGLVNTFYRIKKKMEKMIDGEWVDSNTKAMTTVLLCLKDEVLYYIMEEKSIVGYKVETGKPIHVQVPYK